MRKIATAFLIALVCTGGLFAQEPTPEPKITGEVNVKPHTLVRLKAENVCERAGLRWRVYPPAGVDYATTPRGVLEFVAPPGVYDVELLAISVTEGIVSIAEARVKVTIEGDKPTPPKPPEPGPKPPEPTDPLARDLAALYAADTSFTKMPDALLLIELYRQAAELARSESVTSLGQLSQQVADAGKSLLPRGRLDTIRRRIGEFVAAELGDEDKTLTEEIRVKAGTTYARVAAALKQMGGS